MTTHNPTEKMQAALAGMDQRQKITAGVFLLILIVIIWQVIGLFRGSSAPKSAPVMAASKTRSAMQANAPGTASQAALAPPKTNTPQQAVATNPVMTEREAQLIRMQQDLQARYVAALNELQLLKVARDIAETNQAIMNAKLETISAEKKVVDLLSPQAPPPPPPTTSNVQGLMGQAGTMPPGFSPQQPTSYTVISVSQLEGRWSAVIGAQGNLYSVHSGDILPSDQSKVWSIDKSGVVLEKEGQRKKISLVPMI